MDWKVFVATIVSILAVTAVLFGIGFAFVNEAENNRNKVIQMQSVCIEAGFSGWDSYYGCIGGSGNNV